jgi:hypothetical protein
VGGCREGDLELVKSLREWDRPETLRAFEGLGRKVGDVPQRVAHHARAGVPHGFPSPLFDRLQLGQGERNGPLTPFVQLQPVGKVRADPGHDLPLGLGEPDRDVPVGLVIAGHGVRPPASGQRSAIFLRSFKVKS